MKDQLSMLVEMQRLDDALRETRDARTQLDALKKDNAESLEAFDAMLAERAERISETRAFWREKEAELKSTEDDIRRSRARLPSISSQRELTALNKELEISRRNNTKRTEELLKLMGELEEVEADQKQKQAERDALAEKMAALETELAARLEAKLAAGVKYNQRRDEVRAGLPKPLLGRYDRISRGRKGKAVADVPEGRCGACNMNVPPQVFQRLHTNETMETCNNCQRILVFIPGLTESEGGTEEA